MKSNVPLAQPARSLLAVTRGTRRVGRTRSKRSTTATTSGAAATLLARWCRRTPRSAPPSRCRTGSTCSTPICATALPSPKNTPVKRQGRARRGHCRQDTGMARRQNQQGPHRAARSESCGACIGPGRRVPLEHTKAPRAAVATDRRTASSSRPPSAGPLSPTTGRPVP